MTDEPKKDEPAMVQATVGPYAGQRLTMSRADADAAIADKWAIDPFAPPKTPEQQKEAEDMKPPTEKEAAEIKAKAEKAARKLRGEPEPDESDKDKSKAAATRDMAADRPAPYATRSSPPAKK
jgi:hypothetical protein